MQTSRRISEPIVDAVARLDDFHLHRHFGHIMFFLALFDFEIYTLDLQWVYTPVTVYTPEN